MVTKGASDTDRTRLRGCVTEQHLDLAEAEFPGIGGYWKTVREGPEPPRTFLELLERYGAFTTARAR